MTRETRPLRLALLGNYRHPHCTEVEYKDAWERNGHTVIPVQEGEPDKLIALCDELKHGEHYDLIQWTRTPQLARENGDALQWRLIAEADRAGVPLIGVHLDRWWGLEREDMLHKDPYFRVNLLMTADGGHEQEFKDAGINHHWLLPGVSERWCKPGAFCKEIACDVMFMGSWGSYHQAWQHRPEMISELSRAYPNTFQVYPGRNKPRIVMGDLNDYYWSAKVVIGDSCLVPKPDGSPMTHYCSDRIPETLGRGGILLHPYVDGLPFHYESWDLGDFRGMRRRIEALLAISDEERLKKRHDSILRILEAHTYTHRVNEIIDVMVNEKGLLPT